ncbi:MAG: nitronate monooxygenase [Mycobacterium sp.]|nr:nitronate monooxygenase [Mycobacterium sp.]
MGLEAPIVNAPMGGVAGGALAAAVSRAGGLGMVGMGSAGSPERLEAELRHLSGLDRPFGIGLVDWVVSQKPRLLDVALAARPALLAVSFGDNSTWVRRAHDSGVLAAAQVGDLRSAHRAAAAGIDVVIARGAEGGGHGEPRVGTLPLLAEVLDELPVPVLAAGGISSGRALAAVLAAGASGAWIGTAFMACAEGAASEPSRRALLDARDTDTVTTRAFDVALGYAWPEEFPERVLRNDFGDQWTGREGALAAADEVRAELAAAIRADDHRLAPVNAGQGVGQLRSVRSVADVIAEMCGDARRLLDAWTG